MRRKIGMFCDPMEELPLMRMQLQELQELLAFSSEAVQQLASVREIQVHIANVQAPLRQAVLDLLAHYRNQENNPPKLMRLIDRHDVRQLLLTSVERPRQDTALCTLYDSVLEWVVHCESPAIGNRDQWPELVQHMQVVSTLCNGTKVPLPDMRWIEHAVLQNIAKTGYVLINDGRYCWLMKMHLAMPCSK